MTSVKKALLSGAIAFTMASLTPCSCVPPFRVGMPLTKLWVSTSVASVQIRAISKRESPSSRSWGRCVHEVPENKKKNFEILITNFLKHLCFEYSLYKKLKKSQGCIFWPYPQTSLCLIFLLRAPIASKSFTLMATLVPRPAVPAFPGAIKSLSQ